MVPEQIQEMITEELTPDKDVFLTPYLDATPDIVDPETRFAWSVEYLHHSQLDILYNNFPHVFKTWSTTLQYFISHCRNYVVKNIYNFDENDDWVIKYCVLAVAIFLKGKRVHYSDYLF